MENHKPIIEGTKTRFKELDALRGIAALMVVLFHFTMDREQFNPILKLGTTGVDLFFIISGFVIFMNINVIKSAKQFVVNRIARLYPTYWAAVTFTFTLIIAVKLYHSQSGFNCLRQLEKYAANLTMFQAYFNIHDLDAPYWTLLVEMLFYTAILMLYRYNLLKHINSIGITISIFTLIAAYFFHDIYAVKKVFKYLPLFLFIPLFLAGINFYKIYTSLKNTAANYLIAAFCIVLQIMLFKHAGRSRAYINQFEYACMLTIYFTIFTAFVNHKLHFIVSRVTLFLGKISYALYVIHEYVSIKIIIPILINNFNVNFWVAALLVALPVVILLATLITYYIEIPMGIKLKKRLYRAV